MAFNRGVLKKRFLLKSSRFLRSTMRILMGVAVFLALTVRGIRAFFWRAR